MPRDRATAPSPTYTAAVAIPGERTGVAAKLGERRFFKISLPETASNLHIFFWLSGKVLNSAQVERQLKPPCLCFYALFLLYFLLYVSSNSPVCFLVVFCSAVLLNVRVLLLYCCRHMVGSWVVVGG